MEHFDYNCYYNLFIREDLLTCFVTPRALISMVRGWVEEMGYRKEEYFTKVRPYKVDGVPQLRAEVKRKDATGSHFRRVSSWTCPPLDRKLR